MFFLLVRLLAALSLGRGVHQIRIHIFAGPSSLAVGPVLLSGCIVGSGDDALKTLATNPQNQGGQRTVRTMKRTAAFMGGARRSRLAASKMPPGRRSRGRDVMDKWWFKPQSQHGDPNGGHDPLSMDFF
jgi:hypothetical protein